MIAGGYTNIAWNYQEFRTAWIDDTTIIAEINIFILWQSSLVDLPLKNYYRYVVPSLVLLVKLLCLNLKHLPIICWSFHFVQDDFSSSDYAVNGPKAFFANMPLSKTLTMNLDVPETWLVEPVIAMYVAFYVKFFRFLLCIQSNSFLLGLCRFQNLICPQIL